MAIRKDERFDIGKLSDRLQMAATSSYTNEALIQWIQKQTKIKGEPYSFVDHEYQERILQSRKKHVLTKKCSQLGISELFARKALAVSYMIPHFSTIFTQPTVGAASIFAKTRLDPVIKDSELLSAAIVTSQDSSELKGIGTSLLYIRGTFTTNAAISVPADYLIHDEVDFSDEDTLTSFQSRLTHSKHKWITEISTPTLPDYGIDDRMKKSNRFFNFCRCGHCNHDFIPDYFKHVKIPGYNGDLMDLDGNNLARTRWQEAKLLCPRCGKEPSLMPAHRQWVEENPDLSYTADGFQISPFDAPAFIKLEDLMKARTRYKRPADFVNYSLGLCMQDSLSGIQPEDLDLMDANFDPVFIGRVLGIDVGLVYHIAECGVDVHGGVHLIKLHLVSMHELDAALLKLVTATRPLAIVMDMFPHTETVVRLQRVYPNLYGAKYVTQDSLRPFRFADEEGDKFKGSLDSREISVNRNVALDALMGDIRAHKIGTNPLMEQRELLRTQLRDMRRIRTEEVKNRPDSERFRWVKGKDENDHGHHALLYAWVAARVAPAARGVLQLSPGSLISRIKLKRQL